MIDFAKLALDKLKMDNLLVVGSPSPEISRFLTALEASEESRKEQLAEAEKQEQDLKVAAVKMEQAKAQQATQEFHARNDEVINRVVGNGICTVHDVQQTETVLADYCALVQANPMAINLENPPMTRVQVFQIGCHASNANQDQILRPEVEKSPHLGKVIDVTEKVKARYIEQKTQSMPEVERRQFMDSFSKGGFKSLSEEDLKGIEEEIGVRLQDPEGVVKDAIKKAITPPSVPVQDGHGAGKDTTAVIQK